MIGPIVPSNCTRVGVGIIVTLVAIGFLFAPSALAQDGGDVEVGIIEFDGEEAAVGEENERNDRMFNVNEESRFSIEITDGPPGSVAAGEEIEFTVEIKRTGAGAGSADVTFQVDRVGAKNESVHKSVDLDAGDSEELDFAYSTVRRDLGSLDIQFEVDGETVDETVIVTLPDDVSFAAERTQTKELTVTLDPEKVEGNQTDSTNVTLRAEGVNWLSSEELTLDLSDGLYQNRSRIPGDGAKDESWINTTIEVNGMGLSDTVHLHSVEQTTIAVWTDDGEVYIPVDMPGVNDVDEADVSVTFQGSDRLDADLRDSTTVAVDLDDFRTATDPELDDEPTFESDDAPIGSISGFGPDIRYFHGEVVLWHPHIAAETEYNVTLEGIDGEEVDRSENVIASGPGMVPVPDPGTVAGADSVTLSVAENGDNEALFEALEVTEISKEHTMNASVIDSQTLKGELSFEQLSVSAILIETGANSTAETLYLTDEEVEVDGNQLSVSGIDLKAEHTVHVATNAGIVKVNLEPGDGTSFLGFLIPTILFVFTGIGGVIGGAFLGKRTGLPDLDFVEGIAVGIIFLLAAVLFVVHLLWRFPIPGDPWTHHLGGFLLVGALIVGYLAGGALLHRPTEEYGQAGTRTTQQQPTITRQISITDGNRPIREQVEIEAEKDDSHSHKTRTSIVSAGSGTVTLPTGTWTLRAKLETDRGIHTSEPVREEFSKQGGRSNVTLEIPLPDVSVSVRDPTRDRPIPEASVRMVTDGKTETKRTGADGGAAFDPPLDADSVTLTVGHEKYEETTVERTLGDRGVNETVELRPRTGRLEVLSRIDGVKVGEMDISIRPDEPALKQIYGEGATIETATDENGSFTRDDFIIGRYRVGLNLPERVDGYFRTSDAQASVRQTGETVTLEARFTWNLSGGQRDRIRQIRSDIDNVSSKSGIDTAIPQYYASVVETVLDAVESFPEQGHHFAELDAHPDEVTEATLDAAADTVGTISEAMSTKRNLDLFTACADMTDVSVRWEGMFDIALLIDRLQDDPMAARQSFAERADQVSQRIDTERSDLSEIAPARELLKRIETDDSKRTVDGVVSIHVAILLLDAIEDLFEHRKLRERLSRTVF